jgi:hypothetical protein
LAEEKAADEALSQLAEATINEEANDSDEESKEEEEEWWMKMRMRMKLTRREDNDLIPKRKTSTSNYIQKANSDNIPISFLSHHPVVHYNWVIF